MTAWRAATHAARDTERMKMKINAKDFRMWPGEKVKLRERLHRL
jgi:hypothetical protein